MKTKVTIAFVAGIAASAAWGASALSTIPADSTTVTDYYKQSVYDPQQSTIGTIDDDAPSFWCTT
ncbi:MAG: hypothetical protein JO134_20695 [Xanthobacteraceae bacterium]|nr:hypothetical protein [Xanthobacteraceae bacterium]MBV9457378.1 hypothetical protein [Bradyrhizobium sp.]